MGVDPRSQDRFVDRFRYEIIRARFEAKNFAFLAAVTREHDRGNLGDGCVPVASATYARRTVAMQSVSPCQALYAAKWRASRASGKA